MEQFKDRDTKRVFEGKRVRRIPAEIFRRARMKVKSVVAAHELSDLRLPPSNNLKALRGDREGMHSIRTNDQWRVCFRWTDQRAAEIEVTDYH